MEIQIKTTIITTYVPDTFWYPPDSTAEQMKQIDIDRTIEHFAYLLGSLGTEISVTGEVI